MLKTVWLTENKDLSKGCAILLGGFDGLHVGHRRLLARAKESGLPVGVMTIFGGKGEQGLFTFPERARIFKESGADFVFKLPFSEIKSLSVTQFLCLLRDEFSPKLFVCGEDFRFGFCAKGTPKDIVEWGQVRVDVLSLVEIDGEKVSSRTVKHHLLQGDIEKVNALLGHTYFVLGEVVKDRGVGKTLGFPTANIVYAEDKCPMKEGVYETRVRIDGRTYKGITNFGARPTFGNETKRLETHLDGFEGDLYGREIKVEFVRFLREIQKFDDVDALKNQLKNDVVTIRGNEND